jgi:hypothetical protein
LLRASSKSTRFVSSGKRPNKVGVALHSRSRRAGIMRYQNIDIQLVVQGQIRLPPYTRYNRATGLVEAAVDSDKYVIAWTLVREYHIYKTFVDALAPAEPSLLICGRSHVTGLVELLGDRYKIIPLSFAKNLKRMAGIPSKCT